MTLHMKFLIEFENLAWRNKATTTNSLAILFMLFMSVINCDTKFYFSCIYTSNMNIIIHVISILRFTVIRILAWSRHRGKLVQSVAPTWRRFKGAKSIFCFHNTFHDDSSWKYAVSIYFHFQWLGNHGGNEVHLFLDGWWIENEFQDYSSIWFGQLYWNVLSVEP